MLEIDYDLIKLTPTDIEEIKIRGIDLARFGKVPPIPQSMFGRVVVVNPPDDKTLHHIPDDLRKPLRRAVVSSFAGSKPRSGEEIVNEVTLDTGEILYLILLELHSTFPNAPGVLQALAPRLSLFPKTKVMVHGDMQHIAEMFTYLVENQGAKINLWFRHGKEPLMIEDAQGLAGLNTHLPRYPTFSGPFFSHLGIKSKEKIESYRFSDLKRLYRAYGLGHTEELELSGNLREKMVILDIPLAQIESMVIGKKIPSDVSGIRLGTEKVKADKFLEAGIVGQDISLGAVTSFFRQLPGRAEEEILLNRLWGFRINLFENNVACLWKPTEENLPLYELKRMEVIWPQKDAGKRGGEIPEDVTLMVDQVVVTEPGKYLFGDVRAGIRNIFLAPVFQASLEKQTKLQVYASRLKVACLGPVAGQTLKLLKPHGLDRLIGQDSLYYFCDSTNQIPEYHQGMERLEKTYHALIFDLKSLFTEEKIPGIDPAYIAHRLLLMREWSRGENPPFAELEPQQLDTLSKELEVFHEFCELEFRRLPPETINGEALVHLLQKTKAISLVARQLANLIGGRYGKQLGEGDHPDFVFFGSVFEAEENAEKYFFPGFPLAQLLTSDENKAVLGKADYEFAVFLEEQLSVAQYLKNQEPPGEVADQFIQLYFKDKAKETEKKLSGLVQEWKGSTKKAPEAYKQMVPRMEKLFLSQAKQFKLDTTKETENLLALEEVYFQVLKEVNSFLGENDGIQLDPMEEGDYIKRLDTEMMKKSATLLGKLKDMVKENTRSTRNVLMGKKEELSQYLNRYGEMHRAFLEVLKTQETNEFQQMYERALPNLLNSLKQVSNMSEEDLLKTDLNLKKREASTTLELKEVEGKSSSVGAQNQAHISQIRDGIRQMHASLSQPFQFDPKKDAPPEILKSMEKRLGDNKKQVEGIVASAKKSYLSLESLRALQRRRRELRISLYQGGNINQLVADRQAGRKTAKSFTEPVVAFSRKETIDPAPQLRLFQEHINKWENGGKSLMDFSNENEKVKKSKAHLDKFYKFQTIFSRFKKSVRDKMLGQRALAMIAERLNMLEKEGENLSQLAETRMVPAHALLCERVYIPNTRKRLEYFKRAGAFVSDLLVFSAEELQREFLDRAIYRRFSKALFVRGARFGMNPDSPLAQKLTNLQAGVTMFQRGLRQNLERVGTAPDQITLDNLGPGRPREIMDYVEGQVSAEPKERYNYLILPGTLSLSQALEIITFKDKAFRGFPQMVMVFISKFDTQVLKENAGLHEQYFKAVKHNVLLNIDDRILVDNPKPIGERLLAETLGSAYDLSRVEAISDLVLDPDLIKKQDSFFK